MSISAKKICLLLSAMLLSAAVAFAQETAISGTVTDDAGEPVVGAAVFYDGTNVSAMTARS